MHNKGFIILQIDGLSFIDLQKAFKYRYMPFLSRIYRNKKIAIKEMKTGLPSNTPYTQANMFYDKPESIPGFRWFIKSQKKNMTFKLPDTAVYVDKQYDFSKAILKGGTCYVSLLSGGADEGLFTLSRAFEKERGDRLFGLRVLGLTLINIVTILNMLWLSLKEFYREIRDFLLYTFKKQIQRGEGFFPLVRIVNNVIFREISVWAIIRDIKRSMPYIYMDFTIYDENAHQRGPDRKNVLHVLRDIDTNIRQIYRAARRNREIKYDIFVLSDHGQTFSIPYSYVNDGTFEDFVKNTIKEQAVAGDKYAEDWNSNVLKFARDIQQKIFPTKTVNYMAGKLGSSIEKSATKRIRAESQAMPEKKQEVIVKYSGPMAHIYFPELLGKADTEHIEIDQPGLIQAIMRHKDIEIIACRNKNEKIILGKNGILVKESEKDLYTVKGTNPLNCYEDTHFAYEEIMSLLDRQDSGDLIVFSRYSNNFTINFEEQLSAHGGMGGNQNNAFFACPADRAGDIKIETIRDLYGIFIKYHEK